MKLRTTSTLFILLTLSPIWLSSQNCFNANFETGDLSGYTSFVGRISSDGIITVNNQQISADQHRVMFILDGNDPIAEDNCTMNKELPMVPPGGGAYALRLGNSNNGRHAEKVNISFTVTPENNFFLLNYAVLLNDPNHDPHEQPRFRLSITDSQGEEYPCGFYEVAAAANIENFENCNGNWKVRPWTTIGIELQSYIGEAINIEMRTNDCALGAHAGYAYLDANCRPLEIELFDNCDENSLARMKVTSGFDSYQWSTGDTSDEIFIDGPVVGDIYYVTVTSATGCDLILSDTIPEFTPEALPVFDPSTTTPLCDGTLRFRPGGTNLDQIYSVELDRFIESIVVNSVLNESYTFIAYSKSGCPQDTVTHYFTGEPFVDESMVTPSCHDEQNGTISLEPLRSGSNFTYNWSNGMTGSEITNLGEGDYMVTISNGPCTRVEEYFLNAPDELRVTERSDTYICPGEQGFGRVSVSGGSRPYEYSYDGGVSYSNWSSSNTFEKANNKILVRDDNGCTGEVVINFDLLPEFDIDINGDLINCPGEQSAFLAVGVTNGLAPYEYALNNLWDYQDENQFSNLTSGAYTLRIRDENGCIKDTMLIVDQQATYDSFNLSIETDTCIAGVGGALIEDVINGKPPYTYSLDGVTFQSNPFFDKLAYGDHALYIRDGNLCISEESFRVDSVHTVRLKVDDSPTTCGNDNGMIELIASSDFDNEYYFNGSSVSSTLFTDLPAASYNILVVDGYGCRDSTVVSIQDSDIPRVNQTITDNRCANAEDGVIALTNVNTSNSYSYQWSNGATSQNISGLKNGSYTVTIEDQIGCRNILTYDITSPDSLMISSVNTIRSCPEVPSGSLDIEGAGGAGQYVYSIDGGASYFSDSSFPNLHSGDYLINIRDANGCTQEVLTTIEAHDQYAAIDLHFEMDTCANEVGAVIIEEISSGTGPFSYSLDGNDFKSQNEIGSLPFGQHRLHIQDGNSCVWVEEFSIDSVLLLHISADHLDTTCGENNGTIEIRANADNNNIYFLNGVSLGNNPIVEQLPAGSYNLSAVNQFGCEDLLQLDIQDSDIPRVVESITNNLCSYSEDGVISLASILPQTDYTYAWSNGAVTSEVSGLENGVYAVTVLDAIGCENFLEYEVSSPDSLELEITGHFHNCPGFAEGEIIIDAAGGMGDLEYSIDGGATYGSITSFANLATGEYQISIKDANQCIKESLIQIEDYLPYSAIELHTEMDTCTHNKGAIYVEQIEAGTGPFSYSLDGLSFQNQPAIEMLSYGTYQLYIQDANGCVWQESFEIDSIFTLHAQAQIEHTSCMEDNGSIVLTSSSDYSNSYTLNNNAAQQEPNFSKLAAGTYELLIENRYGCTDRFSVNVNTSVRPTIEALDVSYTSCFDNNNFITISTSSGNPPFRYQVDAFEFKTEPQFNDLDEGIHKFTILDAHDCEDSAEFIIETFDTIVIEDIYTLDPRCDQEDGVVVIDASGGAGEITIDYLSQNYDLTYEHQDLDQGLHSFVIKDTTNCAVTLDLTLAKTCNFYVPNVFSPNGDGQDDLFEVYFSEGAQPTIYEFSVYDRWGGLVFRLEDSPEVKWAGNFDSKELLQGVYTYVLNGRFKDGEPISDSGTITLIR